MYTLLLTNLQKESSINAQVEEAFLKIYVVCIAYIICSILVFYAFLKLKKLLFYGFKKKKRVDPYAQFKNPKSMLGMCISYGINNALGNIRESRIPKEKKDVNVLAIKYKISYLMKNRLLNRNSIITLVTYLENFNPKKNRKYNNDIHYIHSTLNHAKLDQKVLRCFDELLDELTLEKRIKASMRVDKTKAKENDKVVELLAYKYRKVK